MEYRILMISAPECNYDVNFLENAVKIKKSDSIIISKIENIGTLDIKDIFDAIYNGFDGIFVIIRGKIKNGTFISKFISFDKYVNEANRLLEKRGFSNQRISICHWNGLEYKILRDEFKSALKKIIKIGPNPINIKKIHKLKKIPLIGLIYASCDACNNYHFRSLFKARNKILEYGKYTEEELNHLINSIFDAETWRSYIFHDLKGLKPLTLEEIIDLYYVPDEDIIRDIFYLKEQGFIEELTDSAIEDQTSHNIKHRVSKDICKYKAREITKLFKENYFKPISLIFDDGFCCHCGLCSAVCPFDAIELSRNYLIVDEPSCITCGICFSVCPQVYPFKDIYNYIEKSNLSSRYSKNLGYYHNIHSARTLIEDLRKKGQDGGIVTSLLYYLLKNEMIDAVITIEHSENFWKPKVEVIENKSELIKAAGTIYSHTPILSILDKTKKYENIAIVGLPCMIKALWKAKFLPIKLPFFENIKYKLGLFCMESFSYENILNLIRDKFNVNIDEICKMNIKKGLFYILLDNGEELSIPLKEINAYGYDFCHYCKDLTSELADISIGSIGSELGWSSVITRTEKGVDIFDGTIKDDLIETKPLEMIEPCHSLIEKIAAKKREKCKPIELHII